MASVIGILTFEPVQIWSSTQLIQVYSQLGVNEKIKLYGRPPRPVESLGTSKVKFNSINILSHLN